MGCGWLGLPLALKLIDKGWKVTGSTTTEEKIILLQRLNIDAYLVRLSEMQPPYNEFFESEVMVVNIPPSLKTLSAAKYLGQMSVLASVVSSSPVKHVVFISSTSVYQDADAEIITTDDVDGASPLYQSENIFKQHDTFDTTVIRFAGLIGPGRHPSRFFANKMDIPNGLAPVNLIHLDDCIAIIEKVIQQQKFGGIYHAAAPTHPSRQEFYTLAATTVNKAPPVFVNELKQWKKINPAKLCQETGYIFKHPNLMDWVKSTEFLN